MAYPWLCSALQVLRPVLDKAITAVDPEACRLLPVAADVGGGVVVWAPASATYIPPLASAEPPKDMPVTALPRMQPKTFCQAHGGAFLLASVDGGIALLQPRPQSAASASASTPSGLQWQCHVLGMVVPASSLAYVAAGVIFVGSSSGDSQLVRPVTAPNGESSLEVLAAYASLAPIVDMCVMDLDRQGQGQVVAACGIGQHGSLRLVRNGIGIEEQAFVELPGITGLWSVRDSATSTSDALLVQSFAAETRILRVSEALLEEVRLPLARCADAAC